MVCTQHEIVGNGFSISEKLSFVTRLFSRIQCRLFCLGCYQFYPQFNFTAGTALLQAATQRKFATVSDAEINPHKTSSKKLLCNGQTICRFQRVFWASAVQSYI